MPNRLQFALKIVSLQGTVTVFLVFVTEEKVCNFCFLIGSVNFLGGGGGGGVLPSCSVANI